jgi:hypothetical protein
MAPSYFDYRTQTISAALDLDNCFNILVLWLLIGITHQSLLLHVIASRDLSSHRFDRIVAGLTGKSPRFKPPSGSLPTPLVDTPRVCHGPDLTNPLDHPHACSSDRQRAERVDPQHSLAVSALDTRLSRRNASVDIAKHAALEKRLTSMEQRLAAYIAQALSLGSLSRIDLTREASFIAGSIHTHLQFRDAQPSNPETQLLKDRLVSILAHLESRDRLQCVPRLRTEGLLLL